jgi:hypothetical protein
MFHGRTIQLCSPGDLPSTNASGIEELEPRAAPGAPGLARDLSKTIGCRYMVLHAQETVVPFYIRNYFAVSDAEKEKPTKLLYPKVA